MGNARRSQGVRDGLGLFGIWVIMGLILESLAHYWVSHTPYYQVQSKQGLVSVHAFDVVVYLSTALLAFVVSFLGFAVIRYRRRAGETGDSWAH